MGVLEWWNDTSFLPAAKPRRYITRFTSRHVFVAWAPVEMGGCNDCQNSFCGTGTRKEGWSYLFMCQMWPAVARCDQLLPIVTSCCQMWPAVAGCDHLLPGMTSCCKVWPTVARCDQMVKVVTRLSKFWTAGSICDQLLPGVTSCFQVWLTVASCDQLVSAVTRW